MKYLKIKTLLIALVFSILGAQTFAQEKSESKTTIKIIKNENGKITEVEKSFEGSPPESIQEIFEENNIWEEFNFSDEGKEDYEIIIRKLKNEFDKEGLEKLIKVRTNGLEDNYKPKAFLGIYGQHEKRIEINEENGKAQVIKEPENDLTKDLQGVEVTGIVPDSPAEKAGLLQGDRITKLDETEVNSFAKLADFIASKKPGESVDVSYLREGKENTQSIVLAENKPRFSGVHPNMTNDFVFDFESDPKPFLGVTLEEENSEGILISDVVQTSTAEKIGLKSGDIITKINGQKTLTFEDLKTEISKLNVNDIIKVSYLRNNKEFETSGEIKSRVETRFPMGLKNDKVYHFNFNDDFEKDIFSEELRIKILINNISKEEAETLKKTAGLDLTKNSLEFDEFTFAPNPTSGIFQISFVPQKEGNMEITLFDQAGKQVYFKSFNAQKQMYVEEINISDQANGVYFLALKQNNKVYSKKVIKQ